MPLYNTAICAEALAVTPKWLDNLLSHHHPLDNPHNLPPTRQGVARRLSTEVIEVIAVARVLSEHTGIPIGTALRIARDLCAAQHARIDLSPAIAITIDLPQLRNDLSTRLARAMEITPQPQRGRPPKQTTRR